MSPRKLPRFLLQIWPLSVVILIACGVKLGLTLTGSVPFNGDEAVVGLMARHILGGERPIFFYGQAYMGSLDAWLVAGMFRLLGESVLAIRAVQILLYALFLVTLWLLVRRFYKHPLPAHWAVLMAAVPPVLLTTYTTASLGGYGELLVLGNLILLWSLVIIDGESELCWWTWLALGSAAGLAFWVLALAIVYLIPMGVMIFFRRVPRRISHFGLGLAGFLLTSSPWWMANLVQSGQALRALFATYQTEATITEHLAGLLLLGFPAIFGMRFPWLPSLVSLPIAFCLLLIYLGMLLFWVIALQEKNTLAARGNWTFIGLFFVGFLLVFLLSPFGADATGRYLLPLYPLFFLLLGGFLAAVWRYRASFGWGLAALTLAMNGWLTYRASSSPAKITTQFDPITRFDNQHDAELIDFLQTRGEMRGYTNYWVAFRLVFLSGEEIIFAPRLPYKSDLSYSPTDNRYPLYNELVEASDRVAYLTSKHPKLDALLREALSDRGVSFQEVQIGDYHLFYRLSRVVRPEELGLGALDQ
jgi:4-amino-4-deoxy-L-arabinose transferase-like glycosyltransferase